MEKMNAMPQEMMKLMEQMKDSLKNTTGEVTNYKGRRFMRPFSTECVEYALKEWEFPENSVFISSYPKTGTAWCTEIVRQLLYVSDEEVLKQSKAIPLPVHLIEMEPKQKFGLYAHLPIPRKFFCTHLPAELFNFEQLKKSNSKVIYVYRNPKDQAVSWYHFANKVPNMTPEQKAVVLGKDWNEFFAKYTAGEHPTGLAEGEWYPDHLRAWMKHAETEDNVFPVEYESLKQDFPKEIRRMAKFLDIQLSDDDFKKVSERCTVSAMQNEAANDKSGFLKMNVRKGQVGGWKEQLTVSQSELIDRVMDEKLAGTGINFTYVL